MESVLVGKSAPNLAATTPTYSAQIHEALADIRAGARMRHMWWTFAVRDVVGRFRRTILGPFWLTLQSAIWVLGVGLLYSNLFGMSAADYVPVIATGIVIWTLIQGLLLEASGVFFVNAGLLRSAPLPMTLVVFQMVTRQLLLFLHSVVVLVVVVLLCGVRPSMNVLWGAPLVIALTLVNGFATALWLGPLSARYRDIYQLVQATLFLLMFLSPVMWTTSQLNRPTAAVAWNPVAWLIQTFREFMLGEPISWGLLALAVIGTVVNMVAGVLVFARVRRRIPYWM